VAATVLRVVRRVPDDLAAATDPALWDLTDDLAGATAELVVRSRETSVDWILHGRDDVIKGVVW